MKKYKIENLCTVRSSKRIFANQYTNDGIPFYRGKEITLLSLGQKISDLLYINDRAYDDIKANGVPKENDILITAVGTIGSVWLIDHNAPFYFKDGNIIWLSSINADIALPKYLKYLLISSTFQRKIEEISIGSNQKALTIDALKKQEIDVPALKIQQHIVDILGTLDDKIENLEEINSKLQNYCIAKYRLLFSDVERIPLSNIAVITMGQSPAGNTLNDEDGVVFYQGRTDFGFRYPTVRLFTTDPKRMAKAGDILLSVRAPVGDVNIAAEDCCIGRGIAAISSKYNSFVYYSILNQKSDFDIYNNSGTIFGSINRDALSAFKIPAANIALIEKFESAASEMDKVIHNNTLKIYKLRALKQVYLHKFFG